MAMTDPIGDMITRIRNAQQRAKAKVSTPGSKLRERVLEVLKTEGYIRGYAPLAPSHRPNELEIELKNLGGAPGTRGGDRVDPEGRDGGPRRPRRQCRRRDPVVGVLARVPAKWMPVRRQEH